MQISTKGRYALRAMIDLSLHTDQGPVLRKDIAERQGISFHYIGQLFAQLRRAGFIKSVKGPGGGYVLARDAARIRAGDIIRIVEGPIALAACVGPDPANACQRMDGCTTHLLWKKLSGTIEEVLDSVTLKDLCDQANGFVEAGN